MLILAMGCSSGSTEDVPASPTAPVLTAAPDPLPNGIAGTVTLETGGKTYVGHTYRDASLKAGSLVVSYKDTSRSVLGLHVHAVAPYDLDIDFKSFGLPHMAEAFDGSFSIGHRSESQWTELTGKLINPVTGASSDFYFQKGTSTVEVLNLEGVAKGTVSGLMQISKGDLLVAGEATLTFDVDLPEQLVRTIQP